MGILESLIDPESFLKKVYREYLDDEERENITEEEFVKRLRAPTFEEPPNIGSETA